MLVFFTDRLLWRDKGRARKIFHGKSREERRCSAKFAYFRPLKSLGRSPHGKYFAPFRSYPVVLSTRRETQRSEDKSVAPWEFFFALLAHALRHKKGVGAKQRRNFTGGALYEKIRL
jgi:hypothetical protein